MTLFTTFLETLKGKVEAQTAYKATVIEVVASLTHHHLTTDEIVSLKEGVLTLHTSPTVKSIIFLKQPFIIEAMQEKGLTVYRII
ncbi:MAG TPA: hypothetical protein VG621_01040 [Candidatus Paceibacterota bacterium]|nr:hypothetical protein [Candidatus Paceibacterota bacterium]